MLQMRFMDLRVPDPILCETVLILPKKPAVAAFYEISGSYIEEDQPCNRQENTVLIEL